MDRDDTSYFDSSKGVKELAPEDFSDVKTPNLKSKKCSVVLFYAPWCGYCKGVKPDWEKLGKTALFMDVLAFNCEKHSSHLSKIKEELPELVKGFPTIVFYKNGEPVHQQSPEQRDYSNLLKACMKLCKEDY